MHKNEYSSITQCSTTYTRNEYAAITEFLIQPAHKQQTNISNLYAIPQLYLYNNLASKCGFRPVLLAIKYDQNRYLFWLVN